MKIIKNISERKFNLFELKDYILNHTKEIFSDENKATSFADFCRWPDLKTTDRNHLIMPRECCLIDRNYQGESWIMICQFYGKNNGDRVRDIYAIIRTEEIYKKGFKCGYWLIPDLFTN